MNTIQTFLFDVDGTLLDTREFILQAAEHALSLHGYPIPERIMIARLVGEDFDKFYSSLTSSEDKQLLSSLQEKHRDFQSENLHLSRLYPGAAETLRSLKEKGFRMAAVTSRSKRTSLDTLERAGIGDVFDAVVSFEDVPHMKPHPAPLLKALEVLNGAPHEAVMVGDSHLDIEAGRNAGTKTVRATYGFHKERLHEPEPDRIIHDIGELPEVLEDL